MSIPDSAKFLPFLITKFSDKVKLANFLKDNICKQNDIIIRYHTGIWFPNGGDGYGHFSVITEYNEKTGVVTIGNPEMPHFRPENLDKLLYATSDKADGTLRGFYVIACS